MGGEELWRQCGSGRSQTLARKRRLAGTCFLREASERANETERPACRSLGEVGDEDWRAGKWGMDTPVAYAEKLRPRHHAKKNPLLGTLAINQKINPKGLVFTDSSP